MKTIKENTLLVVIGIIFFVSFLVGDAEAAVIVVEGMNQSLVTNLSINEIITSVSFVISF